MTLLAFGNPHEGLTSSILNNTELDKIRWIDAMRSMMKRRYSRPPGEPALVGSLHSSGLRHKGESSGSAQNFAPSVELLIAEIEGEQ